MMNEMKLLDKKVCFVPVLGVVVMIVLVIALLTGCGNKPADGNQDGTQSEVDSEEDTLEDDSTFKDDGESEDEDTSVDTETKDTEAEDSETEETETDGTEPNASSNNSENEDSKNDNSANNSSNKGEQTVTRPDDVNGVEQSAITTKPNGEEIFGIGTEDEPYEEIPNLNTMTVETLEISAGTAVYYNIQRVGGKLLEIEDADAYVITSDGTRYDARNGKVSFVVESKMSNEYVSFQIGNKASGNKAFTIKFYDLMGTSEKPERITTLSGKKSLAEGDTDGYYYIYQATQTGTIRFYITYTSSSDIIVQNLNTSAVRNFTADASGKDYIELVVTAGDEIKIQISAIPDRSWNYAATDITWRGEYAE